MMKSNSLFLAMGGLLLLCNTAQAQNSVNSNLATANWSVNSAHSLAASPPSKSAVWAFVRGPFAGGADQVCDFRFANLRNSGTLSLVAVIDISSTAGCVGTQIFDKTASGFEQYSTFANTGDLRESIQDINHDGHLELILYGPLAPSVSSALGCDAEWPIIFAWTGSGYAEVSGQFKGYYKRYLDSLRKQLGAASTHMGEARQAAGRETPEAAPTVEVPGIGVSDSYSHAVGVVLPPAKPDASSSQVAAPVPAPDATDTPDASDDASDYDCTRIETAKTEQFLGVHSDTTMSAAIKDSESEDPNRRMLGAVIFSYIGSPEANADLKTLANDSHPDVAHLAKERMSYGKDPDDQYRQVTGDPVPDRWLPKP